MRTFSSALWLLFSSLPALLCAEVQGSLSLPAFPAAAEVVNHPDAAAVDASGALTLTSPGHKNLFISPGGNFRQTDAPMVLFPAGEQFVLTVRVAAPLGEVYDVAALVLYQDENNWAKLCYEYSAEKKPTVVSVVTRGVSDDCNGPEIAADHVYYAIVRNGVEYSFHWSADGVSWHLFRHFRMDSPLPVRVGFAVHGVSARALTGTFSEIHYLPGKPLGMRTLKLPQAAK